ncbi:MAG TPA: aminotransferase class I/II-fold pyridoxal phosphate-dependent enzyme [Opitutaceae bacterium]
MPSTALQPRIFLSPPHMGDTEFEFVREAFVTNWIAPVGPHVDAFEREFAAAVGSPHAVGLSSGTAALHLALKLIGFKAGDIAWCSSLTFIASANPVVQEGGRLVFIDSDETSWNLDPNLLAEALKAAAARKELPKALILVHLYGQCADLDPIAALCEQYGVILIEDAAEALGAAYDGSKKLLVNGSSLMGSEPSSSDQITNNRRDAATNNPKCRSFRGSPGVRGRIGIFSFNGNKIITTSGGGMLVTAEKELADRARFLATQARDPAPHYEHTVNGFNYRLSNVLAGIGRGQLRVLAERVNRRRAIYARYAEALSDLPGWAFMPEPSWTRSTRWLTCVTIDPAKARTDREGTRLALEAANIEARPVWKPLHLQPVFKGVPMIGGAVSERLFAHGLCLPSGSSMSDADQDRVIDVIRAVAR